MARSHSPGRRAVPAQPFTHAEAPQRRHDLGAQCTQQRLDRILRVDPLNRVALAKKFRESDEYSVGSLTVAIGLGIED